MIKISMMHIQKRKYWLVMALYLFQSENRFTFFNWHIYRRLRMQSLIHFVAGITVHQPGEWHTIRVHRLQFISLKQVHFTHSEYQKIWSIHIRSGKTKKIIVWNLFDASSFFILYKHKRVIHLLMFSGTRNLVWPPQFKTRRNQLNMVYCWVLTSQCFWQILCDLVGDAMELSRTIPGNNPIAVCYIIYLGWHLHCICRYLGRSWHTQCLCSNWQLPVNHVLT